MYQVLAWNQIIFKCPLWRHTKSNAAQNEGKQEAEEIVDLSLSGLGFALGRNPGAGFGIGVDPAVDPAVDPYESINLIVLRSIRH